MNGMSDVVGLMLRFYTAADLSMWLGKELLFAACSCVWHRVNADMGFPNLSAHKMALY